MHRFDFFQVVRYFQLFPLQREKCVCSLSVLFFLSFNSPSPEHSLLYAPSLHTDTPIHIPAFTGTSYLMLEPLASFLQPQGSGGEPLAPGRDSAVGLYLTLKTGATQGTVLYSE